MNNLNIEKANIEFIIKYYASPEDIIQLGKIENKIKEKELTDLENGIDEEKAQKKKEKFISSLQKRFALSSLEWESKNFVQFIEEADAASLTVDSVDRAYIDLLIDCFLAKKLPYKKIKLYEHFNIKVFTSSSYPGIISYKNKDNIESELWKIYYDVFGEPSGDTLSFIDNKTYIKDGNKWKDQLTGTELSLCDEFLIVDGQVPKLLNSKKTVYYSALYNYVPDQLRLELSSGTKVIDIINNISECGSEDISIPNFDSKWLDKQEKFQRFLVEIYRRTINY